MSVTALVLIGLLAATFAIYVGSLHTAMGRTAGDWDTAEVSTGATASVSAGDEYGDQASRA